MEFIRKREINLEIAMTEQFDEKNFETLTYAVRIGIPAEVRRKAVERALEAYRDVTMKYAYGKTPDYEKANPISSPVDMVAENRKKAAMKKSRMDNAAETAPPPRKVPEPEPASPETNNELMESVAELKDAMDDEPAPSAVPAPNEKPAKAKLRKNPEPAPAPDPKPEVGKIMPAPSDETAGEAVKLDAIVKLTGMDELKIQELYKNQHVIAFKDNKRGWLFPTAQFHEGADGIHAPMPCVRKIMKALNGNSEAAWEWLSNPHEYIEGHIPIIAAKEHAGLIHRMIDNEFPIDS